MMQENSFDPSHSNYVHGSTFQKREDAMPMRAKLITKVPPLNQVTQCNSSFHCPAANVHQLPSRCSSLLTRIVRAAGRQPSFGYADSGMQEAIFDPKTVLAQIDRMAGFTVEHGPYSVNQKGLHVERTFLPPGCLRYIP